MAVTDSDPKFTVFNALLKGAGSIEVRAGFFAEGEKRKGGVDNVAVATGHIFGVPSKNIKKRDFARPQFDRNQGKYFKQLTDGISEGIEKNSVAAIEKTAQLVGKTMQKDIQLEITNGNFAKLKESTIKRKKSSKELIDSGDMRSSVKYKVIVKI